MPKYTCPESGRKINYMVSAPAVALNIGCHAAAWSGLQLTASPRSNWKDTEKDNDVLYAALRDNELSEQLWKEALIEFADQKTGYGVYIIGNNIKAAPGYGTSTAAAVKTLIKHKIGIVIPSPAVPNPVHGVDQRYCQVWLWVPPKIAPYAIMPQYPLPPADQPKDIEGAVALIKSNPNWTNGAAEAKDYDPFMVEELFKRRPLRRKKIELYSKNTV